MTRETVPLVTPAWNWEQLDEGTAPWRAAWADLGLWVRWYTERFELWQSMPVCWFRHSRLVEELRALRYLHEAVFEARLPVAENGGQGVSGISARAYSEWMTTRREWERIVLGLDPREHGGCTGLVHAPAAPRTTTGRADRLRRMEAGLTDMLDTTIPGARPGET
jgi:hypothetical protein